MSLNYLNFEKASIGSLIKAPYLEPGVGVEVELEGTSLPSNLDYPDFNKYWKSKPEPSLRNGVEYIFRKPLPLIDAKRAVEAFEKTLKEAKAVVSKSIRTSTHIHVNVSMYTMPQLYGALCVYYLLEELLVDTQPETRKGNLFCLRMSDANGIQASILRGIQSREHFFVFNNDQHKYGALNLAAVTRFGSFEFRFLQAYTDAKELQNWIRIFTRIVSYGVNKSVRDIIREYDDLPTKTFLQNIFDDTELVKLVMGDRMDHEVNEIMHTNYDYMWEICHTIKKKTFMLPADSWNEDLDMSESYAPLESVGVWQAVSPNQDVPLDEEITEEVSW